MSIRDIGGTALSVLILLLGSSARSADPAALPPAASRAVDFGSDIRRLLARRCHECHGPKTQQGGLRLDRKKAALEGGDSGPAIVPGRSADSLLVQLVAGIDRDRVMPEKGERLTSDEIGLLRAWIDAGATWPDDGSEGQQTHWSLRPLAKPAVPAAGRNRNAIDQFIAARLAQQQLTLSPAAEPRTLLRRLYFDLIGLPPTPEEVEEFADHFSAYAALVDKLLASRRHGERWAQHWLDVVRFAESDGFETNKPRANAWPFRDYVIAALNADKPYNQFLLEQLVGDVVGMDAATGFLVGGANDVVKSPDPVLTSQQRADVLHDVVSTTASAMLGLTVGCARCHNHKFDPISQVDYYRMKAVFEGVQHGERPLVTREDPERAARLSVVRGELMRIEAELARFEPLADRQATQAPTNSKVRRSAVHPRINVERFSRVTAKKLRFTIRETTGNEPCIDELEVYSDEAPPRNIALAAVGTRPRASSVYPNSPLHKLEHINDGQTGNSRSWISAEGGHGWVELEFPAPVKIDRVVWGRDRQERYKDRLPLDYSIEVAADVDDWQIVATSYDREKYVPGRKVTPNFDAEKLSNTDRTRLQQLLEDRARFEVELKQLGDLPSVYAGSFSPSPATTHRFHRGDSMQPRETVEPGALKTIPIDFAMDGDLPGAPRSLTTDQRRRFALARWVTDSAQPLTARVIVNRLWQQHFGEGLVATPSDFGANGARPSHPELLDWLACELMEHGWSLRHIHRLIVNSATYRQSSAANPNGLAADAGARLLWRYPPRRLEAEPLRDAILAVSGKLDLRMGGPGFSAFEPNDNYVRVYNAKQQFGPEDWRRTIYMTKIRMQQDGTFGAFDCPDGGQIAPRRNRSTTPLQALNLLNSPFIAEQAAFFADRVTSEAGADPAAQVRQAFRLAFQRDPQPDEMSASEKVVREQGLTILCRVLLNSNEFLYVY